MSDTAAGAGTGARQLALLIAGIAAGGGSGLAFPRLGDVVEPGIWLALGMLLYTEFTQVRLSATVRTVSRSRRFVITSLAGNFVLVPLAVAALAILLPSDTAIRLGALMVLLVPCTDWFVTFTRLGRGDPALAVGTVPTLLFLQFLLLPAYLWLLLGKDFTGVVSPGPFARAFLLLIVLPFAAALLTRRAAAGNATGQRWLDVTEHLSSPLLAVTLFLVAASQASLLEGVAGELGRAVIVFALYAAIAAPLAWLVASIARLGLREARTLAFNFGTRNSFVVLPLALALPEGWELTAAVVVLQSVVELAAVMVYLWWVPRWLLRDKPAVSSTTWRIE